MKEKLAKKLEGAQKDGEHGDVTIEDGSIKMCKGMKLGLSWKCYSCVLGSLGIVIFQLSKIRKIEELMLNFLETIQFI